MMRMVTTQIHTMLTDCPIVQFRTRGTNNALNITIHRHTYKTLHMAHIKLNLKYGVEYLFHKQILEWNIDLIARLFQDFGVDNEFQTYILD